MWERTLPVARQSLPPADWVVGFGRSGFGHLRGSERLGGGSLSGRNGELNRPLLL